MSPLPLIVAGSLLFSSGINTDQPSFGNNIQHDPPLQLISGHLEKQPQALNGSFSLGPKGCGGDTSLPCILNVELHGAAAQLLYDNMVAPASPDACTGGQMKMDANEMMCFLQPSEEYSCYFGYAVKTGRIVGGDISC